MTKEKYVLDRVKMSIHDRLKRRQQIDPYILSELIEQWEFDYEIESECNQDSAYTNKTLSFNWQDINGKTFRISVGEDSGIICVIGKDLNDGKLYVLHIENSNTK